MGLCKDGYWREYERYEGKTYTGCGKDQRAALKDLAQKVEAAKNGTTLINKNTTVKAWAKTWLETYVKHSDITDRTYLGIESKVNKNIVEKIGGMRLKDVKEVHLQKILNEQEGKSFSHASKLRSYMKGMFHRAVKSKLIPFNPAEDLQLPKTINKKRRPLSEQERTALLNTTKTHPAGLWIKTMLYLGLRPGETRALQWRDIDLKNNIVNVSKAIESGTKDKVKAPKSEAGFRSVPIPEHLVEDFKAAKKNPLDYVFTQVLPKNKGKPHTESSLQCYWNSFLRQMDIELGAKVYRNQIVESKLADDLCPYTLRHTYGTDLQAAGVPINIAKYLMGHEDISTTANIYTHENDDTIRQAAKLINAHVSKKVSKTDNIKAV